MHSTQTELIADTQHYRLAKQSWDERYGSILESRKQWKLAAFCSLGVAALAVAGCIHLGSLPKTVPVLFTEDASHNISYLGAAKEMTLDDQKWDAIKHAAFVNFVEAWRTVTSDQLVQNRIWDRAFSSFVGKQSPAKAQLDTWFKEHNPTERAKTELVSAHVDFDNPVSANTYEIGWTETVYTLAGESKPPETWRAVFTYVVKPPGDQVYNPFGVYITQIVSLRQISAKPKEAE